MKKYFLLIMLFSCVVKAAPFNAYPPYTALYGGDLIYDLNNRPILALMDNDLKASNLLGAVPSFNLFKTTRKRLYYPDGSVLVTFQLYNQNSGVQNIFYQNGGLFTSIPFENNQKNGTQKIYYANGVVMAQIPYVDDVISGELTTFYDNGNTQMKLNLLNNIPQGSGKMFHQNGNLQLQQTYLNGLINGIQTQYYEDGSSYQSQVMYENGVMTQKARLYYFNSAPLAEIEMQNGQIISQKCYTEVGQESVLNDVEIYKFLNGMRPIKCYFQSEN